MLILSKNILKSSKHCFKKKRPICSLNKNCSFGKKSFLKFTVLTVFTLKQYIRLFSIFLSFEYKIYALIFKVLNTLLFDKFCKITNNRKLEISEYI